MHQRDGLPRELFSAVLESVYRKLDWKEEGLNLDNEKLTNLRFLDDIVLIREDCDEVEILKLLNTVSKNWLKNQHEKTKVMFNSHTETSAIKTWNMELESVQEIKYTRVRQ